MSLHGNNRCPACGVWCFSARGLSRHWNAKTRMLAWDDDRDWSFGQHWQWWLAAEGLARFLRTCAKKTGR